MKKTMRTAAIFSAAMLCSTMATALPTGASMYNGLEYENLEDHIMITGCDTTLTTVEIPAELEGLPVTHIGGNAFNGCNLLTEISIPDTVTLYGDGCFAQCDSLTSITIPPGATKVSSSMFNGCDALTEVRLPESINSINAFAFYHCSVLTSMCIPDGTEVISSRAFEGCTSLTDITFPDTITEIEATAFSGCDTLTSVFYLGTAEEWAAIIIGESNEALQDAMVYFADGTTSSGECWKPSVATEPTEPENTNLTLGDLNGDSYVNASDSALILQFAAAVGAGYQGTLMEYLVINGFHS